jgi:hypothetical protein
MSTIIGNSTFGAFANGLNTALWNSIYGNNTNTNTNDYYQKSYPIIYTTNMIDPDKASTFVSYTGPNNNIITYGVYNDLNKDRNVSKTITKYYYYKILDKWLLNELLPLLGFVEIVDGKPRLIRNLADYNVSRLANEPTKVLETKIDYLAEVIISKEMVKHVLKKFIDKHNTRWSALNKMEYELKEYFFKYIKNKLEDNIAP